MNDSIKNALRQMQDLTRSTKDKELTWENLEKKMKVETKRHQWQYRTAFTGVLVMLFLFIILLVNGNENSKNAMLPLKEEIASVHYIAADSKNQFIGKDSRLYLGVKKLSPKVYRELETLLAVQQEIFPSESEMQVFDNDTYDLVITFKDGHQQRLKWNRFANENGELLMLDWDKKIYYTISKEMAVKMDEEIIALKNNFKNWSLWPLVILGVMIVEALLSFLIRKKYRLPKKPDLYPEKKWLLVDIGVSMIILFAAVKLKSPLYAGWLIPVAIILCCWQFWINQKLTPHRGYMELRLLRVAYLLSFIMYLIIMFAS
ncbi:MULTISPECIES: hypothetical protein [Lysinibacillus]|uniref:hypothetical protein n=1 Tax=Lysinibacillus TaxID=400634 RepID=UPI00257E852C|nr:MULTISPECIES: hypothetical protein [Lysinibacillus]